MSHRAFSWILGGVTVAAAALGLRGWLVTRAAPPPSSELASRAPRGELRSERGADDEVARLRGELKKKDEMLRTLVALNAARSAAPDEATGEQRLAATAAAATDPVPAPEPHELLDERLLAADKDPRQTAELHRALHDIVDRMPLGDANVQSLECASSLCKVVFASSTPEASAVAANAAIDKLPKLFASSVSYRVDDRHTAVYAGRSGADTEVALQ